MSNIFNKNLIPLNSNSLLGLLVWLLTYQLVEAKSSKLTVNSGERIALVGAGLGSRMIHFGEFETYLQMSFPTKKLVIRNLSDEGNTPGFRPHSGRSSPWAFPEAAKFQTELAYWAGKGKGQFKTPDQWLTRLKADTIIAFFGFNSAFEKGISGLKTFEKELQAFLRHLQSQKYNGVKAPQIALVSPTAIQNLSHKYDVPNGIKENKLLKLYTESMRKVANATNVLFIDVYTPSNNWYSSSHGKEYTIDGALLNAQGYKKLAKPLAQGIYGNIKPHKTSHYSKVKAAVMEKNWMWTNDFKVPNGVHVFGRRYAPYGNKNYPHELQKTKEMTAIRDQAIWLALQGKSLNLAQADSKTHKLPLIQTNYNPSNKKNGSRTYLTGEESNKRLKLAPGYKMTLFASEEQFPDLANPVQMSFDNKGNLWVAVMPSYPHYQIGDSKPNDKILIFKDTNNDGKADEQIIFADKLHLPIGFEITHEGVYVTQSANLVLLKDTDGDDKADVREVILSGFDDHDTHHAISAFCADPSGAIILSEGTFLRSNIETIYGPVRAVDGGFWRYTPQRKKLDRYANLNIPNPWGVAYDKYGQDFFIQTSNSRLSWMSPVAVKLRYGKKLSAPDILTSNKVRPTSGLEFVSSRHFPKEVQGDILMNNDIGFLGAKQHQVLEGKNGFTTKYRQDLFRSTDSNFRPVDLEFAPDGSLYVIDWSNVLIGHMQHNARDPFRDHVHGRIYRVTYPSRPLVKPAKIYNAPIPSLLDNLKLPEYRTRYRTRRELRGRNADQVILAINKWSKKLNKQEPKLDHYLLEALWVTWGINRVNQAKQLLNYLLRSKNHRIRAAATRVVRFNGHLLPNQFELLMQSARDPHTQVRLEAITAASWLDKKAGIAILREADKYDIAPYMEQSFRAVADYLGFKAVTKKVTKTVAPKHLNKQAQDLYLKGKKLYAKDASCATCHAENGQGLPAAGFPPLAKSNWVTGNEKRLINIVLKGLSGPIKVSGKSFNGSMPGFGQLYNDEQIAAILTYVRNSWSNKADPISPKRVKAVRASKK